MLTILLFLVLFGTYLFKNNQFKKRSYYKITKNSFLSTLFDLGRNGEYQIYNRLRKYEKSGGKFLFNCYLPKDNGETTEIDVLLITSAGIFAFESKNYSGWIFGDEKSKNWTQTLPQGKGRSHKEQFFNPIIQNKVHIKWLRSIVGNEVPLYSIIVFSERCTLKNVNVTSNDVHVINRQMILSTVERVRIMQSRILSQEEVNEIYNKLYPFTQVSEEQKYQHILNIKENYNTNQSNNKKVIIKNEASVDSVSLQTCPKCGAQLVLRTAKRGANSGQQFYGCSNYPKCHYIN